MDGTYMTVFEFNETKTGKKKKYQYDWEYQRGKLWKWHNEPHSHKQHQTVTDIGSQVLNSRNGVQFQTNYHIKWIHRLRSNIL
ncbi:DUF6516 family protein [Paenibacillus sp. MER TA 81-3]|uniref:toxin-antitoxin system TumE family protein n=1 Tax=Paenibacillus sp. MER TA 81-3 TaxID=2939573 RepID=UPI0034D97350